MRNKIKSVLVMVMVMVSGSAIAADAVDPVMEQASADAVAEYDPNGSLFQQITDLEQAKILLQLEKEQAQLDLELDRLAAEKIKLHMEIDTLAGRAEEQQAELDTERARLEAEAQRLEREKEAAAARAANPSAARASAPAPAAASDGIDKTYKLIDIVGAGRQLQATLEHTGTGQRRKVSVGQKLENDAYTVESISLADGVVFDKDGAKERLNIAR